MAGPGTELDPSGGGREGLGSRERLEHQRRTFHISPIVAIYSDIGASGDRKVANGVISAAALPLELKRLQILWPSSGAPLVQANDEVQVNVVGLATRADFKLGDS